MLTEKGEHINRQRKASIYGNQIDRRLMYGRHRLINDIVRFLAGDEKPEILFLVSIPGIDLSEIAQFSIDYASNRGLIKDGEYKIPCKGVTDEAQLKTTIM